jgi:inhibitor of cysteine peptidase
MKSRRYRKLAVASLLSGLLCCVPHARRGGMPETVSLTAADQGVTRDAVVGESVLLQLAETPSTGYRWALEASPPEAIEMLATRWVTPAGAGVGAAGRREFSLRIKAPGEIRLNLKLWREWLGDSSVAHRYEFVLRVR